MKKYVLGLIGIAVLAGIVYSWRSSGSEGAAAAEINLAKVVRGNIESTVSTTGRVTPNLEVDIKCKASGKVLELPFDVSDMVKQGDLLVELDPVDEQRAVTQAQVAMQASQARLDQARENLRLAETNLELNRKRAQLNLKTLEARARDAEADRARAEKSFRDGVISAQDYERARTAAVQAQADLENGRTQLDELKAQELALEVDRQNVELARSQVKSDELRVADAKQRLDDTKVYAPIDGVVAMRLVQKGMIISSGITTVGGGTTVMTVADMSRVFVMASVDESDIGRVAVDQPAKITADAFPTRPFNGKVVQIATKGINAYNVVTFEVKIEVLDDHEQLLKPEMTTNVEILLDRRENVLKAPVEAIWRENEQYHTTVLGPNGRKEARIVEVGITDGVHYEILSGLKEGEILEARNEINESKWRGEDKDSLGKGKSS